MTDRVVTVGDDLTLPASVVVPPSRVTGTAVVTDDARLSDARTPTDHKTSHATGATDALAPADIGAATAAQGALAASASQPGHTHTLDQTTDTATRVAMTPAERTAISSLASTYARSQRALSPLARALATRSRSFAIGVLGDSTGNGADEWPYLLGAAIAADYPDLTVQWRLWNDATQTYSAPTTIQTGTAGAQYLQVAVGKTPLRLEYPAVTHVAGPMDIRVKLAADVWTANGGSGVIAGREGGALNRVWWLMLASDGRMQIAVSADGTNITTQSSTANLPTAGLVGGNTYWLRCVYTPDNGAGGNDTAFYWSTDGAAWTQLGATVTVAGVKALYNATAAYLDLGGRNGGRGLIGRIYEVLILDGVDGPNTVPQLPDCWGRTPSATLAPMDVIGAPVLTILNGSHPGANITYLGNATRLPKMIPDFGQVVTFLSSSHNEAAVVARGFRASFAGWVAAVQARLPYLPVVAIAQNPENGALNQASHDVRRTDLLTEADATTLGLVDIYQAFVDDGHPIADLMADTVHPNAAGQAVWTAAVLAAIAVA